MGCFLWIYYNKYLLTTIMFLFLYFYIYATETDHLLWGSVQNMICKKNVLKFSIPILLDNQT